ncbi:MAG TPA: chemotaxis protein CheB [Terriglobales bacterium]|nr:chemotaxis protein CheB [Terriglobales bacterium]
MAAHPWFSLKSPFAVAALVASAGGLEALEQVLPRLNQDFPVPLIVLLHRRERSPGSDLLVRHLSRFSPLPIVRAKAAERIRRGVVYVAPPDRHLLLASGGRMLLSSAGSVRQIRPSADILFESLAEHFGPACIAVVLSGSLHDGAIGAVKIKASGGMVLVQDPATTFSGGMPNATIATGCADFVLPPRRIADALITLAMVPGASSLFSAPAPGWARVPIAAESVRDAVE